MPASFNTTPMPEKLRPVIEAEIERLIALLDAMDGDPDLEPSLGFSILQLTYGAAVDECEDCCEDEGGQCDDEGVPNDNGIADWGGVGDGYAGHPLAGPVFYA